MLEYDTTKRVTAGQMLLHPWVNGGKPGVSDKGEGAAMQLDAFDTGAVDLTGTMAGLVLAATEAKAEAGGAEKAAAVVTDLTQDPALAEAYELVGAAVQV